MTIDKLYVCYEMTKSEFKTISEQLNDYLGNCFGKRHKLHKDKHDQSAYVTYGLCHFGFQEIRMRKSWNYRALEIRLRPEILGDLDGSNYYGLTRIKDFQEIGMKFDYIMQDIIGLKVPSFFEWRAKHVEYTIDLLFDENLIPILLFLVKKGNIPDYMLRNDVTQRYFHSEINTYLNSTTVTAHWYNRYKTLQEKERTARKQFKDYEITRGLLRFEVQEKDCNKRLKEMLSEKLCQKRLWHYFDLIVGKGDYYTLEKAKEIIRKTVKNHEKKIILTRFLEFINKYGSVWAAKRQFANQLEFKSGRQSIDQIMDVFSSRLCKLRELGINPVCLLPEWGVECIENMDRRIRDYFIQQMYLEK